MIRSAAAVIAWVATFVIVFSAALGWNTVMGIAGICAAVSACVWGILGWLADEADRAEQVSVMIADAGPQPWWLDEEELPYRPVEFRPTWDTDVMGAPE